MATDKEQHIFVLVLYANKDGIFINKIQAILTQVSLAYKSIDFFTGYVIPFSDIFLIMQHFYTVLKTEIKIFLIMRNKNNFMMIESRLHQVQRCKLACKGGLNGLKKKCVNLD